MGFTCSVCTDDDIDARGTIHLQLFEGCKLFEFNFFNHARPLVYDSFQMKLPGKYIGFLKKRAKKSLKKRGACRRVTKNAL
jgi:hypothetical protein